MRVTTPLTALAVSCLTAASVMLVPGSAAAESWSHRDPAGDVVLSDSSASNDEPTVTEMPKTKVGDVRIVRVRHTRDVVRITARLRSTSGGRQLAFVHLAGPRGLYAVARAARGATKKTRVSATVVKGGDDTPCRAASGRIDHARDRVEIAIPTSCLGDPAWVRAAVFYMTFSGPAATVEKIQVDDGLHRGYHDDGRATWSPRIARG